MAETQAVLLPLFGYIFPAMVSIPITRVAVGEFVLCVVQTLERHGIVWSEIYSMCTSGWCVQTKPCWKIICMHAVCVTVHYVSTVECAVCVCYNYYDGGLKGESEGFLLILGSIIM